MSWGQVYEYAELLSYGLIAKNLLPETIAEDKIWKFIGIKSINRKEWYLLHLANMF